MRALCVGPAILALLFLRSCVVRVLSRNWRESGPSRTARGIPNTKRGRGGHRNTPPSRRQQEERSR